MMSYFSLRIPIELKEKLTKKAKKQGISLNALIVSILWKFDNF